MVGYGGVEWVRAGRGMWHGKELSAATSPVVQGFQLWIALPPELEMAEVTLKADERWVYKPLKGHTIAWAAVGRGLLNADRERVSKGELAVFEESEAPITLEGGSGVGATFVLGSAAPHPYELHLGSYSVHTSFEALTAGERHIRALQERLVAAGDRTTEKGSTPVFRG